MSDLSKPNVNARPQRKCTRPKKIYEDYEMTKISNSTGSVKRRRRQFKKPLLDVDIASNEDNIPSNLCIAQPLMDVDIASNEGNIPSNLCITEPLLDVDIASNEGNIPSNLCIAQPLSSVDIASNESNIPSNLCIAQPLMDVDIGSNEGNIPSNLCIAQPLMDVDIGSNEGNIPSNLCITELLLDVDVATNESNIPSNQCITQPLLDVDIASNEGNIPSNLCITQPLLDVDVAATNESNIPSNLCVTQPILDVDVATNESNIPSNPRITQPLLDVDIASNEGNIPSNLYITQPLLDVDVAATNESNIPSNLCVTQPILDVDVATNESNIPSNPRITQPNNSNNNEIEIFVVSDDEDNDNDESEFNEQKYAEIMFSKHLIYITADNYDKVFPGYNPQLFSELKTLLIQNKATCHINRDDGSSIFKDLYRIVGFNSWLNDTLVQQYFNILKKKSRDNVFIFGTFFFIDLNKMGFDQFIEKYLKDINLFDYSKLLFPTHVENHWILLVVDLNQRKLIYYDSLDSFEIIYSKLKVLIQFLNEEYIQKNKDKLPYNSLFTDISSGMSPKQENTDDCGIFMCTNARYNLLNKPSNFKQSDIPLIRQRMLYEIVHSVLLPTV